MLANEALRGSGRYFSSTADGSASCPFSLLLARGKLGLSTWHFAEIDDIDDIKPALTRTIQNIVDEIDAAPDTLGEALRLLASLPEDFYLEGREDPPIFEQREPFE